MLLELTELIATRAAFCSANKAVVFMVSSTGFAPAFAACFFEL